MKPIRFDELDEKIIAAFQAGDRVSNRAVARELGLSEGAIRKRMKRLTESGAISYGLAVDVTATGFNVHGWLVAEVRSTRAREVAEFIGEMETCSLSMLSTGEMNVRAYVYARDDADMSALLQRVSKRRGVTQVTFKEAIHIARHRYELIMFGERPDQPRWLAEADTPD
jgi:Lrp/AsnC family transcriptional regulator for asnA, asnC and gidA